MTIFPAYLVIFGRTVWNFLANCTPFYKANHYLSIHVYYYDFEQVYAKL
jgi:hypothetical protein